MIKEIQALRFWAILFIILTHIIIIVPFDLFIYYQKFKKIFFPNVGVELFFVIAGYFLMHTLSKQNKNAPIKEKTIFLVDLFIKKLKRLSPAVYFWAVVMLLMSIITNNQDIWLSPSLMIQKFFASILYVRDFEEIGRESDFGFYWAISLEFQFFIIFPIIYSLLGKIKTIQLSSAVCVFMMFYRFGGGYYWIFRFDGMLYGAISYYLINDVIGLDSITKKVASSKASVFFISTTLLLGLLSVGVSLSNLPYFSSSIASIISSLMLVLALTGKNYFFPPIPIIQNIFIWIGDRSFSLFCCHIISWLMVKQIYLSLNINTNYMFISQIAFMFVAADLTHRFIENVFINK